MDKDRNLCLLCMRYFIMSLSRFHLLLRLTFRPAVQQALDDCLNLEGRMVLREIFAKFLALEGDGVPAGLFLLAHDSQHTVLGQRTLLALLFHTLGLRGGVACS